MAQLGQFKDLAVRLCGASENGPNGCMNWTGYRMHDGYGTMRIGSGRQRAKQYRAHRVSASVWKGFDLHSPLCVLHKCDNPACINPDHLFIGTSIDNNKDRIAKGRSNYVRGERHGHSKLSPDQVLEIRCRHAAGTTQETLSELYGVSSSQICHIVRRNAWRHL